jgi:hypothetical protein
MSDTLIQSIVEILEEHIPDFNQRKSLYESLIPVINDYDPEIMELLCDIDTAFLEEYKTYVATEHSLYDEEYDD